MEVLYQCCEKGNAEFNEDAVCICGRLVCVIDGATDVFADTHPELQNIVYRYVGVLKKRIEISYEDDKSISEILLEAIRNTYEIFNSEYGFDKYPEYELPNFAIACFKQNDSDSEYLILGDCSISYIKDGKETFLEDDRINEFSEYNRNEMKRLGLDPRKDKEALEVYRRTRARANMPSGYPIGSVSGKGIAKAVTGRIGNMEYERVLIFSDGFIDYYRDFEGNYRSLFTEERIMEFVKKSDEYYLDDNKYIKQLRPKQRDDKTIVLFER